MKHLIFLCFAIISYNIKLNCQTKNGICTNAIFVCSKDKLICPKFDFNINSNSEILKNSCFPENLISGNSKWLKFEISESGVLEFNINPIVYTDDIDFIVFKSDNLFDCTNISHLRCMASGNNYGNIISDDSRCKGATGMRSGSLDEIEIKGCIGDADNYLSPLKCKKNDVYYIYIHNYSSLSGFEINFNGTCEFRNSLLIKNNIIINNLGGTSNIVQFKLDSIFSENYTELFWDFGENANPRTSEGFGPHTILFESNGKHEIKLIAHSISGCIESIVTPINIKQKAYNKNLYFGQVYPNPVKTEISIPYFSSESQKVQIEILNVNGSKIFSLNDYQLASSGILKLNVQEFTSGVYFIRIADHVSFKNSYTSSFTVIN